jgi:microcystin-dependent protein
MSGFGVDRGSAASQSADPDSVIDESLIDAKGDLIAGLASNSAGRLAAGANETRLVADSTQATGLKWVADTVNYLISAAGDLIYGTAADTAARLAVGAAKRRLAVNSGATAPEWVADTQNTVADAKGDLIVGTAADTVARLAVGASDGMLLSVDSAEATGVKWVAQGGFTTGDAKLTLKTTADDGWVMADDGTIGNAASGASTRSNNDTEDLFTLIWNNTADAQCAVSTGRGASAAADFAADKTIALPKALGRALAVAGAGSGLTSRVLALITGTETHTLVEAEMPSHFHTITANVGNAVGIGGDFPDGNNLAPQALPASDSKGGDDPHENMQPTLFLNAMIKL